MDRRKFIKATAATGLVNFPVLHLKSSHAYQLNSLAKEPVEVDQLVFDRFQRALNWICESGWNKYIEKHSRLDASLCDLSAEKLFLTRVIDRKIPGFDDFSGNKLIEPGDPARSFIYHVLASPRVHPEGVARYPDLEILDAVENYIYDSGEWNQGLISELQTFFMVLAYEYRPAYKSPPKRNAAELVFSKTGFSRVGNMPRNYDASKRCFTNKPDDIEQENNIAVFPARYGLFEVELVKAGSNQISIMNRLNKEYRGNALNKKYRYFINPIRKVYDTDDLQLSFSEYHRNEKLRALADYQYAGKRLKMYPNTVDTERPPFVRVSCTNDDGSRNDKYHMTDQPMVTLERIGSSVLLTPSPTNMVAYATQNGKKIAIKVPAPNEFEIRGTHKNRRYASLKLPNEAGNEVRNVISSDILGRLFGGKRIAGLRAPKNAPLFLNIKYEYDQNSDSTSSISKEQPQGGSAFEEKIDNGGYLAQVFEDALCDGCIAAKVELKHPQIKMEKYEFVSNYKKPTPAVSFVTAPDFFPLVDSNDIRSYFKKDHHFYEGGTLNLSAIRLRGNPNIMNPHTGEKAFADNSKLDKSYDTNLAVISKGTKNHDLEKTFDELHLRDYQAASYLPDTGTGVFYPAWDATYSGKRKNPFLATIGLGSPFPEDMKLCAAANGMWPVTSPDAGRTYQGSLDYLLGGRPNTSIPLLDEEIGFNSQSPFVRDWGGAVSFGWDGEQGPFFTVNNDKILVNYTDIARADYVHNLLEGPGFNMSKLRELDSRELIRRMRCLENCIKALESKKVWKTKLWLVSAVSVDNWAEIQKNKSLPNHSLFLNFDFRTRKYKELEGQGYLFVFADVPTNKNNRDSQFDVSDVDNKRRVISCEELWVCQVTEKFVGSSGFIDKKQKHTKWVLSDEFF